MNAFFKNKILLGLGFIPFSVLADDIGLQGISLESYLRTDHPEIYQSLLKQNIDFKQLESQAQNTSNNNTLATQATSVLPLPSKTKESCTQEGGIFLENNYVATCVSKDGTFGNGSGLLGMTFNPLGTGTVTQPDYLRPGSPHEYFSVSIDGTVYTNNNNNGAAITGNDNIPTTITNLNRYSGQEGGVLATSTIDGGTSGLRLTLVQKYSLEPESKEIVIRTEVFNSGKLPIKSLQFARGLDPDQDISTASTSTYSTYNQRGYSFFPTIGGKILDVSPQNIVWASGKISQLFVALYSIDSIKHNTCVSKTWTTNPTDILNQRCNVSLSDFIKLCPSDSTTLLDGTKLSDSSSLISIKLPTNPICIREVQPTYDRLKGVSIPDYSDSTINIAFDLGSLNLGEKKVFSYRYMFRKTNKRDVMPYIDRDLRLTIPVLEYKSDEIFPPTMYFDVEMEYLGGGFGIKKVDPILIEVIPENETIDVVPPTQ